MDGVLERIEEDDEQRTDHSALTEGDEGDGINEGAPQMMSSGKRHGEELGQLSAPGTAGAGN